MKSKTVNKENSKSKVSFFKKFNNFFITYRTRIVTGFILLACAVVWMFIGGVYLEPIFGNKPQWSAYIFMVINTIIFGGCLWEIINLRKDAKWSVLLKIFIILTGIILLWIPIGKETFGPYIYNHYWFETWMTLLILIFFICIFILIAWRSKNFQLADVVFIFTWIIYLVFAFKAINFLMLSQVNLSKLGWPSLLLVLVIVVANDVGAFLGGVSYGKTKIAPKVSPNKTWEGAITGLVTAIILSMVTVTIFLQTSNYNPLPFLEANSKAPVYIAYLATSFILSIASQMGDLLFSYLKRNYQVKDFSNFLPGHGGLLDRLDSFSAVAIFAYLIALAAIG
ncbi:phosphatidate cytidylyltransferase [Spiroplasma endosymbiont of Polydrusus pterygomalis]|uniref:phosphatidate cytidylyltransferase n=1 Tax=Spiroplasma endosymbiont of Polydrusus pterygomalis TaxID=3139327 RepID=UPI003CCAEFF6